MSELSVGKIRRGLKRFEDFAGDLARSDMNTFDDRLRLLVNYCQSDPVLSIIHNQLMSMSGVDFEYWHKEVLSTVGGMVGSGELSFPTDLEKRMALMYQLLNKIAEKEIDLTGFAHNFFATGNNGIDSLIYAFNDAVVEPLTRELSYRIEELEEDLPDDNREIYSLANIQIIHNAENVVQQSATGNNIQQNATIKSKNELEKLFDDLRDELKATIEQKQKLEEALNVVETSKELARKRPSSLLSVKILLGSLGAMGNVGSIVSAIIAAMSSIG